MDDDAPSDGIAGWALRTSQADLDVDGLLSRFGQVHRVPVAVGTDLAVGTPCFLVRTDRNRVVGIWAVGEVVAPVLELPAETDPLPAEVPLGDIDASAPRTYAEVELLPLSKPVALAALLDDPRLTRSALRRAADADDLRSPLELRAEEVRALESNEWWIEAPSDDQRAELDRLLAAEDPILDALGIG